MACGNERIATVGDFFGLKIMDDGPLRGRAPLDLGCDAVRVAYVDGVTRLVGGCGVRVIYRTTSTIMSSRPEWTGPEPIGTVP
jgi:hypothetical protein